MSPRIPPAPMPPSQTQEWAAHLELALEHRFESAMNTQSPAQVLKAILDAVAEARQQMGW